MFRIISFDHEQKIWRWIKRKIIKNATKTGINALNTASKKLYKKLLKKLVNHLVI